jgi:hypothetical protein
MPVDDDPRQGSLHVCCVYVPPATAAATRHAPNYLQDLTRDRAADGGNWNDRIDQIAVC